MKQLFAVLFSFVLLSLSTIELHAQSQPRILGKVIDADSKEPLIGARITFDPEYITDSALALIKVKGAISRIDGTFELITNDTGGFVLEIKYVGYENGYVEFISRYSDSDTLYAALDRLQTEDVVVEARAQVRTVEDLCCRVEALNAELTNVAPFTADMQQVMSRYSSCTSYHINCTLDHSSTVRLRGLDNPYTLMLVDNVPIFSALTSQYGLQMIPSFATENVRILEGSSTTQYGNNAMVGALSFDLRLPKEVREAFIQTNLASSAGHGLEGAYDLNAVYSDGSDDVKFAAVVSHNSHPAELPDEGVFSDSPGLRRFSGYGRLEAQASDVSKFYLTALGGSDRRDVRIGEQAVSGNEVRTDLGTLIGKLEFMPTDLLSIGFTGAYSHADHRVGALTDTSRFSFAPLSLKSKVSFASAVATFGIGDHFLTSGLEWRDESVSGSLDPIIGGLFSNSIHSFATASFFAEDQIALADEWTVLIGGRFDYHTTAGNIFSPRTSISWRPSSDLRMRVMAGQGVKGQALFNEDHRMMHGIYRYEYNDAFDYEKALNLNYDMTYTYMIGESIGGEINVNTFYSLISGKAIPHTDSLPAGKMFFVNDPDPTRLMGIEVQTRPSFGNNWSGSLAFSIVNLMRELADGREERVPLSPTINADASIMYQLPESEFAIEAWGSIIGKQIVPENPYGIETSPVFGLVNLRAQKKLGAFTLHAGVLNILDAEQTDTMPLAYNIPSGTVTTIGWGPMEGREFFAGLRVDL
jgi:outer membrane receptor for ferrienterochelin and colicins